MGGTYSGYYASLDPSMRQSPNMDKALKGFAFLNDNYPEAVLVTTPSIELYTLYRERYFPNVSWAEGYANKLWEAFSRNPATGKFDPVYATDSVRNFTVPQLTTTENMSLRAFISKKYFYDLNSAQKDALLAAYAKYIQDNPLKEASVLTYLPGEVWQSTKNLVTNPVGALLETIQGADALFPKLVQGLKQWAVIGIVAFVAIQFGPMIVRKLAKGRK